MRFPIIVRIVVISLWLSFLSASLANAQNASCFSLGTIVVTDSTDAGVPASQDIDKVYLAEPLNGDGAQTLTFTLKVLSLQSTPMSAAEWNVIFTTTAGISRYVRMSTMLGSPAFTYGTVTNLSGTPIYSQEGSARGTYNKSGYITIYVDKTLVGKPALGSFLTIEARTYADQVGTGLVQADATDAVAYQARGNSDCLHTQQANFGLGGDVPVVNDYTQNGTDDIALWRPSTGGWFTYDLQTGETNDFTIGSGASGDVPIAGDYDNDSRGDHAVYRPSTGTWQIHKTETGENWEVHFGIQEDIPVTGDFDGDLVNDVAVFRPSSGVWYVFNSLDQTVSITTWGSSEDHPIPADYDGDGRTDVAVFRPSTGTWFIYNSLDGSVTVANFGVSTDIVVPADYDGDGKADLAVWRPDSGDWYVYASATGSVMIVPWGTSTDLPQVGDFNGNARADLAVWRPATGDWFIYYN